MQSTVEPSLLFLLSFLTSHSSSSSVWPPGYVGRCTLIHPAKRINPHPKPFSLCRAEPPGEGKEGEEMSPVCFLPAWLRGLSQLGEEDLLSPHSPSLRTPPEAKAGCRENMQEVCLTDTHTHSHRHTHLCACFINFSWADMDKCLYSIGHQQLTRVMKDSPRSYLVN